MARAHPQRAGHELEQQPAIAFVAQAAAAPAPRPRPGRGRLRRSGASASMAARRAGAIMASEKRAPGISAFAAIASRALSTRLPSSCRSSSSSAVASPQATCRPSSAEAVMIVPGGAVPGIDVRQPRAMEDVARCRPRNVKACGQGQRPRIRLWMSRRRLRPVDAAFGLRQLRRVGGERVVLRRLRPRCRPRWHRASRRAARRPRIASIDSTSLVVSSGPIGTLPAGQHRSGIERLDDPHDRDAGFAIAGDHGAMNGRGAAIAWQQRRVHVDQAARQRRQQPVRQDLAVGGHHADVGAATTRACASNASRDSRSGCKHRKARGERQRLHRAVRDLLAAAARAIGLRDHADDA